MAFRTLPLLHLMFSTLLFGSGLYAQTQSFDSPGAQRISSIDRAALDREVRADMSFLADDEMHGRGSATRDEHIAALFVAAQLQALGLEPGGTKGSFLQKSAVPPASPEQHRETWNAIGILRGSTHPEEVVLLTAHLDHLGMAKPDPARPGVDLIYNGADDDASGTTAVLALAHLLATGPRPARTILFALFGSEELGGYGDRAFLAHPPVPLPSIVANLEFEMIGRPDPAIPAGTLWLTGYERSNLGLELAKHGARLVRDPHAKEDFFQRSDNYALAKRGIIAHTVSSFGLHKDYHRVSDDLGTIDFQHMTDAIAAILEPMRWLVNSDFKPAWNPGQKP
jgi:hypothetical protein